jgi:hypothetical protein
LEDRKLRNDLEHFDERLDLYLNHGMFGYIFPSLIMAKPDETGTPHHIFRAFYLIDGIFQILGERYQMQPIVDEMTRIHRKLVEFDENGCVFKRPNVKQEIKNYLFDDLTSLKIRVVYRSA